MRQLNEQNERASDRENDRACVALWLEVYLDFGFKIHKMLLVLDWNPLEFLLKQIDYSSLFSISDRQRGVAELTIHS